MRKTTTLAQRQLTSSFSRVWAKRDETEYLQGCTWEGREGEGEGVCWALHGQVGRGEGVCWALHGQVGEEGGCLLGSTWQGREGGGVFAGLYMGR